ncbi:hypothetical protein LCGC14_1247680 [marine sediment metagenome]|uniref:Uncharacterized protein n=1 Tax=marine sediment metagenome TaxID=412755 RepID=A0A0F9LQY3_9ZZZZ
MRMGPVGRDEIAALKEEAENAPDTPGSADWGRKAVLRLIASHEALRDESMKSPGDFQHCDALDTILKVLQHCEDHPPRDPGVVLARGDLDTIQNQVYALRAYIAGLERRP